MREAWVSAIPLQPVLHRAHLIRPSFYGGLRYIPSPVTTVVTASDSGLWRRQHLLGLTRFPVYAFISFQRTWEASRNRQSCSMLPYGGDCSHGILARLRPTLASGFLFVLSLHSCAPSSSEGVTRLRGYSCILEVAARSLPAKRAFEKASPGALVSCR